VPSVGDNQSILSLIGGNIRRERLAKTLTQEKLSERAELNIRTLQKIEAGKLNVLITTLIRIQKGIGCSWDKLLPSGERNRI